MIQVVQTAGSTTAQTITLVAAIIAALAALGAAAVAAFVQRKTGAELDQWRKREETMRMLRWGADHAIKAKDDPVASKAGQAALELLKTSQLVQPEDKVFIEQVVASIVDRPAEDVNPEDEVVFDDEQ